MIKSHSVSALDLLGSLKDQLGPQARINEVIELEASLEMFDFKTALECVENLAKRLDITPAGKET